MPPNIVDIIIKVIADFPAWLQSIVNITVKATPSFGVVVPFFLFCGFFLLMAWWFTEPVRG